MKIGSNEEGIGTVVGANVRLQGTLKDTNDISVYGTVEGEVISDKMVIIADTAMIKGPVTADIITVSGEVKGSIEAKTKLEILPSGKVNGSITCQTLIIQSGAKLNGKSTMAGIKSDENVQKEEKTETNIHKEKDENIKKNILDDSDIELE